MRGFPPAELLLLAVIFAVALVPLLRLTGTRPSERERPTEQVEAETIPAFGTVKFSHAPTALRLLHEEVELFKAATGEREIDFEFESASDGCDLVLEASWPEGEGEVAIEIVLEPEGIETQRRTLWGAGEVAEVVGFSWPAAAARP